MNPNNSTLKNKLRNYSILAGSALTAVSTANGQIRHTNVNDVIVETTSTYNLDLNGDGTTDFIFHLHSSVRGGEKFKEAALSFATFPNSIESIAGSTPSPGTGLPGKILKPYVYVSGQAVSSKNKLVNGKDVAFMVSGHSTFWYPSLGGFSTNKGNTYGNWDGTKGFLALRVKAGGNDYYGWARIYLSNKTDTLKIFDYAYQATAGMSILAGDTGTATGISTHQLQNVSVYSSGRNVFVKYPNARDGMAIVVTDMLGKEVRAIQTTNELYEMTLANAAAGVYTVTVKSKEAEMTKKISIQ